MSARERGNVAFKAKDYLEAKQLYTAALLEEPMSAAVWCNRSAVHLALGCPQFAAADAIRALSIEDDFAKAPFRAASAFAAMSGFKQAVKYFEASARLQPDDALIGRRLQEAKDSLEQGPTELQAAFGQAGKYSSFYRPPATSRAPVDAARLKELSSSLARDASVHHVVVKSVPQPGVNGLGLFCEGQQPKDAMLLKEMPALAISYRPDRCVACAVRLPSSGTVQCTSCESETYCSAECRSRAWDRYHKSQCGAVSKEIASLRSKFHDVGPQSEKGDGRLPSHYFLLAALRVAGIAAQSSVGGSALDMLPEFSSLCSLTDETTEDVLDQIAHPFKSHYLQYTLFAATLSLEPTGQVMFDFEFYDSLWHVLAANLILVDEAAVLPRCAAYANHSCAPNTEVRFRDGYVELCALRVLENSEEVLVAYVEDAKSRARRRQMLLDGYWFHCVCAQCRTEDAAAENENGNAGQAADDSDEWLNEAARMMPTLKLMAKSHDEGSRLMAVMEKHGWDGTKFCRRPERDAFEADFSSVFHALGF
eukprot:TRINITY_DN90176_c0_g1_i1.p1 TRINITY_DN90176_c0_g1~~TRINITY_DN90176_c0_g1_i1.p1  ORF type:complete len:536 (-),score=72.95 TRINITY_DN90176_c0_g1_i1:12-1619(-)